MKFWVILVGLFSTMRIYSQTETLSPMKSKPVIDTGAYRSWQNITNPSITNDGKYIAYNVNNLPSGSQSTVIKSVKGKWNFSEVAVSRLEFSDNSRWAKFFTKDTLTVLRLGNGSVVKYSGVFLAEFMKFGNQEDLIVSRQDRNGNEVIILNCNNGRSKILSLTTYRSKSGNFEKIALVRSLTKGSNDIESLIMLNLNNFSEEKIWEGKGLADVKIDYNGDKVAYVIESFSEKLGKSCYLYLKERNTSQRIFDSKSLFLQTGKELDHLYGFNRDESNLLFFSREIDVAFKMRRDSSNVVVWSYIDPVIRSYYEKKGPPQMQILNALDFASGKIRQLMEPGDVMFQPKITGDRIVVLHENPESNDQEYTWNSKAKKSLFLLSIKENSREPLAEAQQNIGYLSPDEKFVLFNNTRDYFSYDVELKQSKNLTKNITTNWFYASPGDKDSIMRGIVGWTDDNWAIVSDRYDIWLLDPSGKEGPVNVTNGYGKRNRIIFNLALYEGKHNILKRGEWLLNGIDMITKKNGFFKINSERRKEPEVLVFDNFAFDLHRDAFVTQRTFMPIKAKYANTYLLGRMSATESLNLFLTSDFKRFNKVTNICPERDYNWYTVELHSWINFNGKLSQGLLYKPADFDSTRKYPIIFNYYDIRTFNLNVYLVPNFSSSNIDIPTYVSKGFLVFTPDFEYEIGNPMRGVRNSIISAVRHLSQFSFIDSTRMALQGFSMGGVETYFLVANTNLFAAACAGSGQSNFISGYGSIAYHGNGDVLQANFQSGQVRMGGTPWDNQEGYIKNSPIFTADRVSTPLLLMHTTNDPICPFAQAIEFYSALRRLGKKVWLLEYKDGYHGLSGRSAIDFSMRMEQFFNHYLKGDPAPDWMVQDIYSRKEGYIDK